MGTVTGVAGAMIVLVPPAASVVPIAGEALGAGVGEAVARRTSAMACAVASSPPRAADTQNWAGGKIIKGSEWLGGAVRTGLSDSQTGRQTLQGRIAGSVIELGGGAYGLYQQYQSIQNRADGKQRAVTEAFDARIANKETASWALVQNQGDYVRDMVMANRWRAEGLTAAEVAGASWAVAGANRGAAVAKGGVNQGYHLDLQANRITYDGAVNAATQVHDASFEAARLRALSSVVSAVGHNVARDMEQGLALRY
jgi:hypothetical protein